jgi:hypothetical protein
VPAFADDGSFKDEELPGLSEALGARLRVARRVTLPLWAVLLLGTSAVSVAVGAAAYLGARSLAPKPSVTPVAASAVPSSAMSAASAEPPATERAARGDPKAIEQLAARKTDERTTEESVALALGREQQKLDALAVLRDQLKEDPERATEETTVKRLREFIEDPRTAVRALRVVANLPGEVGPDYLYQVWTGTAVRNDTTQLAESLVYGKEVRPRASSALSVALDLRSTEDCEQLRAVLERTVEHGDRRALRPLGRLMSKTGCGPNQKQDCYRCLRAGTALADAVTAARKRAAPKF